MKLNYYHYYFREKRRKNPPRVLHDIRPILAAYLAFEDNAWKGRIEGDDGEKLLLVPSSHSSVFMLIGTRQEDIIKAINARSLTCVDLARRLRPGEKAGFVAYFSLDSRKLGLASTLRGPRTAALCRFIQNLLNALGAENWKFCIQSLGTAITMEQAQGMALVARTEFKVSRGALWEQMKRMLCPYDDVESFQVIVRARRNRSVASAIEAINSGTAGEGLDAMTIRASSVADEALADYFVEKDGKLGEDIGHGSESEITNTVANRFAHHPKAATILRDLMGGALYEDEHHTAENLGRLGELDFWRSHIRDA